MQLVELPLKDAYLIELKSHADDRGAFCRLFCSNVLKEKGITDSQFVQVNLSDNFKKGTLRGLHYQSEPYSEAKIVYCLQGSVYDVIVDLREDSPTFKQHFGITLSASKQVALYIPKGFAHGFLTLEDESQLLYLMSEYYHADYAQGYCYNDPAFNICWPADVTVISEKDRSYLPFNSKHACRFCHTILENTFCDLGYSPLSNAYLNENQLREKESFYPLHAQVCSKCLLVQLPSLHTPDQIFSEYAYFSSYSTSWLEHAKKYTQMVVERFKLNSQSYVMEIASNDGYLLQFFVQKQIPVLGIEPAKNVAKTALDKGVATRSEFFNYNLAKEFESQVDLLIANNVLAHVPDLNDFVASMKCVLKQRGVITLEFPHLLRLMEENQFDTIYHEHFSYFSFLAVQRIFAFHKLTIFDVEKLSTHGGSLRIYVKHQEDDSKSISDAVVNLIEEEKLKGLHSLDVYRKFGQQAQIIKKDLLAFFAEAQQHHKSVVAYGAPAKGNTLLNYCGVNSKYLSFTVDKNTYKQGKFLPGTHIPIFSPSKIFEIKPDYVLILPWNLKDEITHEMRSIQEWGGRFVVPIPKLTLI